MGVDLKGIAQGKKIALEDLSGQSVAIDAYNALYQFLAIIRGEGGEPLRDSRGRVTSHLSGLFYRNINLLSHRIRPIYILDGRPPALKAAEIERRRAVRQEAVMKYAEALSRGDLEEARKHAQATSVIKDYMLDDTKRILELLGIPWIEAPSEGEATASHLTKIGIANVAASQDFDSLLFGATKLVRNLTISGRRKLPGRQLYVEVQPEEIELRSMLSGLGITREHLVDVAIMVGTDFNPDGIKGVGPAKAMKYIKKYGRLEEIKEIQEAITSTDYKAIREIFLKPNVASISKAEWGPADTQGIISFLCKERDFSEERIRNALQRLEEAPKRSSESLERWFG